MTYPYIEMNLDHVKDNARAVCDYCAQSGISVAGVVKFSDGDTDIAKAYFDGGCPEIASSRVTHLRELRQAYPEIPTLLIRMPMACEVEEAVRWCDTAFCTSFETLHLLEDAAAKQEKTVRVLLILDVGDLREGVMTEDELVALAVEAEKLPHIALRGIGSTFGCYGSVLADRENLTRLCKAAELVEKAVGHSLETVSGGSSSSLMALSRGEVPARVNHLRIGGFIANPMNMRLNRHFTLPGTNEDTFFLHAQIVESNVKPTCPQNQSGKNWTGNTVVYEDLGIRRRAIAALGEADVGDVTKLIPVDQGIRIMGGSSDHLILDTAESEKEYAVGDVVTFRMQYSAMLHAFTSRLVVKNIVGKDE